ncbi:MAG: nuclear transport factor 2 family protein [Pseudomonadota bacterium]
MRICQILECRTLRFLLFAALMTAGNVHAHDDVRKACTDLVLDYAYYRDRPDADALAALFAEDAELSVLGQTYVGREAITARLRGAENGPSFRHLMSTIRIFPVDATFARGVSYVTVYSAPHGASEVEGFLGMGEYHDEFVLTEQGWRIAAREYVPVYTQAAAP